MLWIVYAFVAAATFMHSAWGFGTLESAIGFGTFGVLPFPITGAMAAFAVDAGMAGLVFSIQEGRKRGTSLIGLYIALSVALAASAFTQLLYAVTHAAPAPLPFNVAPWMLPTALAIWEWRIIVLPLLLPSLGLVYAFSAGREYGEEDIYLEDRRGAEEFSRLRDQVTTGISEEVNQVQDTKEDIGSMLNIDKALFPDKGSEQNDDDF